MIQNFKIVSKNGEPKGILNTNLVYIKNNDVKNINQKINANKNVIIVPKL